MAKKSKTQRAKASAARAARKEQALKEEAAAKANKNAEADAAATEAPKKRFFKKAEKSDAAVDGGKQAKASAKAVEKKVEKAPEKKPAKKRRFGFLKDVRSELKRVTWPTKQDVLRWSVVVVVALVFFGVLSASRWFNFDTIYQLAFPLFIVGFLFVMPTFGSNAQIMALCYDAGYTMLSMYIMIVMSNITYRFGVNAVWINGIERGIRYVVELVGWLAFAGASAHLGEEATSILYGGVAVAVVLTFVVIFFTERGLSAKWGVVLKDDPMGGASAEGRMAIRVSDLSRAYNLSPREEEVLQLIAQGDTVAEIEEVLYVSQGTVKAHINHIYRKFNIHSKSELFELLNDVEKPVRKGRRSSSSAWEDEERQAG